ncbi:MAG: PQQ-binding-like beta-propeller repeat protein [Armatimonadia bacterium]
MAELPTESTAPVKRDRTKLYYRTAVTVACVAAVFCLVVLVLLVVNAVQARSADPSKPAQIEMMKADLAKQPTNQKLRDDIRKLDQDIRWSYYITRLRAIQGAYLLLGGVVVLLVSLHFVLKLRTRLPVPTEVSGLKVWLEAAVARRTVILLGVVLASVLLVMAVLGRHDPSSEYAKTSVKDVLPPQPGPMEVPSMVAGQPTPVGQPNLQSPLSPLAAAGSPGLAGPQGPAGPPGPTGPAGERGPAGEQGRQGEPGPAGPAGTAGFPGRPGGSSRPGATGESAGEGGRTGRQGMGGPGSSGFQGSGTPGFPGGPQRPGLPGTQGGAPAVGQGSPDLLANWPVFRGYMPGRVSTDRFPVQWDAGSGQGVLWKAAVPLPGKGSPVAWKDRVYLSGANDKQREVYAFDVATGKLVWKQAVVLNESKSQPAPEVNEETGYAASTMTTDGKNVVAMFANGDVAAFDLTGKQVWSRSFGPLDNIYGHASSPILYRNLVLLQLDQGGDPDGGLSGLLALDVATGKTLWRTPRPVPNSWSTPIVAFTGRRFEILTMASPFVISYDPGTGKELWRTMCLNGDVAPSPAFGGGLVLVAQDGSGLFAIRPPEPNTGDKGEIVWQAGDGLPDICSPAANDEVVILAASGGLVTCYETATGKKLWEHDLGTSVNASPVIAGKLVYLTDTEGVTHIFEAGPEFKAIGVGKFGEPVYTTAAFAAGKVFVRGTKNLFCVGAKPANG